MVEQPAKVMRIGSMIKQLLEEVRAAPLDEASRVRLKEIHASSVKELEDGSRARAGGGAGAAVAAVHRRQRCRPRRSCGSPRPSWWAGWRASSTASRPRCSPSRWRPAPSWSRCAARCRRASAATRRTRTPAHAGRARSGPYSVARPARPRCGPHGRRGPAASRRRARASGDRASRDGRAGRVVGPLEPVAHAGLPVETPAR